MSESQEFQVEQLRANCKWYFGHKVQIITYFNPASSTWSLIIYHVDSNLHSSSEGGGNNTIHLYATSTYSLWNLLNEAQFQIGELIAKVFAMEEGARIPTIKELPARCNCQHPPSPLALAENKNQVPALEARLQTLEDKLRDGNPQLKDEDSTGTHNTPTAKAGSIGEIEPRMQERPVETTNPIAPPEGPPRHEVTPDNEDTTRCGDSQEQFSVPSPSPLEPVIRCFNANHIRGFAHRTQSRSPSPDCDGTECEDSNSDTHITPSTAPSERSVTPRPGPEVTSPSEEPELTRAILRQEINKALAAAMIGMGELLGRADNDGA